MQTENILKRKSFATLIKCKFRLIDSVILRLTSPALCLAYVMKIRTLQLMVAQKTSKLQSNHFLKSHRGTIPYIVSENEISNQCLFSKAKRTTNAKMEILCLGRRLSRMRSAFKFGRI